VARNFTFRLVWLFSNKTSHLSSLEAPSNPPRYIFVPQHGQVNALEGSDVN
jgi:hypothetical protein